MSQTTNHVRSLTARWIIPIDSDPLPDGIIQIQGDRITAVKPHGWAKADVELSNSAVLPGFVNAHTHLDLSGLKGKCPPSSDLTDWLRKVIKHRRQQTTEQIDADICIGLQESIRNGTTLIGDISAEGRSWPILSNSPIRAVVFRELIGLTKQRADDAWQQAGDWLASHQQTSNCRPGISPHAPYSVRKSLFERVASLPQAIPIAVHVCETTEELQLLRTRRGVFYEFLEELGAWDEKGLITDIDQLLQILQQRSNFLIHGNYLNPDQKLLKNQQIVYCPRTHNAFGHAQHPWEKLHEKEVPFILGTDSLASNPGLDMLGELRFLYGQFPCWPAWFFLYRATQLSAALLGWGDQTGSLTEGKSADLVVAPLTEKPLADPHQMVLESPYPVAKVMCRGRWIFDSEREIQPSTI